jgi:hypothetical protein
MKRAAEFYWAGNTQAFEESINDAAPKAIHAGRALSNAMIITGRFREGVAVKRKDVVSNEMQTIFLEFDFWRTTMELMTIAHEATNRVEAELKRVRDAVMSFRETTKNDLASLKASSDRVQTETMKMSKQYREAVDILTSPQFVQAIENAERLATALTAIQNLNQTKLSFAVFGEQPHEPRT